MKKTIPIIAAIIATTFYINFSFAQQLKYCGQVEAEEKIKKENPRLYQQILRNKKELEDFTQAYIAQRSGERGTVYTIPVVFHIIHENGTENISNEQVYDAVRIINADFRKLNADTSGIVAAFKDIAEDVEIEFRLAQKDPQGNCTSGITRSTSDISFWPRAKYLNIKVVKSLSNNVAGYTYNPGSVHNSPGIDGIIIMYTYIGSIGTGDYTRARALTHEIGHWLNLAHTWGGTNTPGLESNCDYDDGVDDTPNTIGWTYCDLNGTSCGSLDNVQNYMEYSYCSRMFTEGQVARMRAAVTSSIAERRKLWQATNLAATGVTGGNILCKAEFTTNRTEICVGETVDFSDASFNNPTSWNWAFTGATPSVSSDKNPSVTYNTPGRYNVELTVSDGTAGTSITKSNYITVLPSTGLPSPFMESFEVVAFPSDNWSVNPFEGGKTWEIADVGSTGSKSIKINNASSSKAFSEISSSTIDLTSIPAVHVSFKVAFAKKTTGNMDELKFFASKDCGENWAMRWSRSGSDLATVPNQLSSFVPGEPGHWVQHTVINLPTSYLVENFRIKFQFTGDGGNNIYIDDINVYDPATVDIKEQDQQTAHFKVYPNPFKEEARIVLSLSKNERVKLSALDLLGKETTILSPQNLTSGEHYFSIKKGDLNLSKGIYFIRYAQGDKVTVKKVILN